MARGRQAVVQRFSLDRMVADYCRSTRRCCRGARSPPGAGRADGLAQTDIAQRTGHEPCAASPASSTRASAGNRARRARAHERDRSTTAGPTKASYHVEPGVGLGHRRLSIIDVATGQQPLFNEDGSVVVIFNGEIYNYQELIPELVALGHVFRTRSDTEVIVHAWEAWGEDCVERFRGMFAFALWDRNRETLFLARDRLGVKPLYYALLPDGKLMFGSELKSLLAHGGLSREIDPLAVEEYFALGYVPEPRTIFAGVAKLPPAHTLTIRRGAAAAAPKRILGRPLHARQPAIRGGRARRSSSNGCANRSGCG